MAAIGALVGSRGTGFVAEATFPEPAASDIQTDYEVPVKPGQRGWRDRHGNWYSI